MANRFIALFVALAMFILPMHSSFAQVSGGVTSTGTINPGDIATFKSKAQIKNGSGTPLSGQCYVYTGTYPSGSWGPGSCAAGGAGTVTAVTLTSAGTTITLSGISCNSVTVFSCNIDLPNKITAAGPIGDSSHVAAVTYDAQGRLTTVSSIAIALSALGILPCAQLPTFTGDVTNSSCVTTIAASVVTNAKLASMTGPAVKGVISTGNPVDLTAAQVTATFCNLATISLKGCGPILSGNATDYSGGDGAFHAIENSANPTAIAGPTAVNGTANNTYMPSDAAPAVQKGSNAQFGIVECDNITVVCPSGIVTFKNASAVLQTNPANPTPCATATCPLAAPVMMGLGSSCHLTPLYSTRVHVTFYSNFSNSISGNNNRFALAFGTGTAPINAAPSSGTAIGLFRAFVNGGIGFTYTFSNGGNVTGLTPGTAYWFDATIATDGGTISLSNVTCSIDEF